MSRSVNKVTLVGNLGSDPEVRSTTGGSRVATFSLATSRQWTDGNGQKQEKTQWHRCVGWNAGKGKLADIIESYLKKGDKCYIEGSIEYRQWQDKENQTRYSTEINVRELVLLGSPNAGREVPKHPASAGKATGKARDGESFEDFPGALADEDDELPF